MTVLVVKCMTAGKTNVMYQHNGEEERWNWQDCVGWEEGSEWYLQRQTLELCFNHDQYILFHCLLNSLLLCIHFISYLNSESVLYILWVKSIRLRLKCDGTRAETKFCLSAERMSLFKSAGASVQSTTGSRSVRISGSNARYTIFRGSEKGTGYPLHSPVSPLLPHWCVTVYHHISIGL